MTRIWTGTAAVVSGYTTVALTGDPLSAGNAPLDATIVLGGATYFVGDADYPTMTVELTRPYEGADGTVSAEIDPMTPVTGSVVSLAQQLTTYDARLNLVEADGKGLFYTIVGQTGANDPGPGKIARDAAAWADVTELYLDVLDAGSVDATALIDAWIPNSIITIRSLSSRAYASFRITIAPANQGPDAWRLVDSVVYIGGQGSLADGEDVGVEWNRPGSDGRFTGDELIKTAAYTAAAADVGKTIVLNKATADTLSFQAAATLGATWMAFVKNIGAGAWTLDPNGAELIDGAASLVVKSGQSLVVTSNGTTLRSFFLDPDKRPIVVASRTALKAVDTTKETVAQLVEAGREGTFLWMAGDYSVQVSADTAEGVFVAATGIASSSGAWVRLHNKTVFPEWFGATGGSNDAVALQACLSLAYAYGWTTRLSRMFTATSALTLRAQVVEGTSLATGIKGNHGGRTFDMDGINTDGLVLRNMMIQGDGTNATNGTSTGLWISSATEITAHAYLENVRFWRHGKGIDGTGTYTLFDSTLLKCDFLECATWGQNVSGSQNTMLGCTYRLCGWGVKVAAPSGNSIGGGVFDGCTFISNTFDVVFSALNVRPLRFYGCWFEQCVTLSFGQATSGEFYLQSLVIDGCIFQPSATATVDGVMYMPSAKGSILFESCLAWKSPYASASIPGGSTFYSDDGNLNFRRINCTTDNGSGTIVALTDEGNFGVLPMIAESVLLTDFAGSNVNSAQPVFSSAQDAITLRGDTTYEFEAEYFITRAAGTTSHTTAVLFGGTATFDAVRYLAEVVNPTGNVLANVQAIRADAATAVTLTAANTSATENLAIKLKGRIRTNAGGTLIPQFQYSAAPGGAPTVLANSSFRCWAIGSDQVAINGPWA